MIVKSPFFCKLKRFEVLSCEPRLTFNGKLMAGHGLFYDATNTVTLTQLSQQLNLDCTSAFELWGILDLLCPPLLKPCLRREHNNTAVYQSLESLLKTVTSPSHSSHSDRSPKIPHPTSKVESSGGGFWNVDKLFWTPSLCVLELSTQCSLCKAPKFISCFLRCHICFKVWACLIVHYSMPIYIQIFLLEIIFQISLDGPQYSDGLRFPTQSPYSWPNLGLEWSICSKSRVASSCLPGMMNIHSSIRKYVFSSPQQIYSQLEKLIPGVGK